MHIRLNLHRQMSGDEESRVRRQSEKTGLEETTDVCYFVHVTSSCECIACRHALLGKCTVRQASDWPSPGKVYRQASFGLASHWWRARIKPAHSSRKSKQLWPHSITQFKWGRRFVSTFLVPYISITFYVHSGMFVKRMYYNEVFFCNAYAT